jgi:hypothetical protein
MACMTLLAPRLSMATTQFMAREIGYEVSAPRQLAESTERQNLRMNWVVVTGKSGSRGLRMHWTASRDS